ncbi:MAG TPA: hypothetical protein VF310_08630 [Vicinamibacteria bacterium]
MKKILAALSLAAFVALPAVAEKTTGEWTGYITDTHCGEKGASKDHTAGCVEKCMKAGSKAQLWLDKDKKAVDLDSFDKVKGLVGQKVTVKGTLDSETKTITVDSAAKADK